MTQQRFDLSASPIENGITLIDASAGTGKTYAISSLVTRLLAEGVADDISQVLVVTFTNAAADELAGRIRARLQEACLSLTQETDDPFLLSLRRHSPQRLQLLHSARARLDEAPIHTIHGFCKKVLEESAFESGLPLECTFLQEERTIIEQAALDFWRERIYPQEILAAYVAANNLTPKSLLDSALPLLQHEKVAIRPPAPELEALLAQVGDDLAALRAEWDGAELLRHLHALPALSQAKDNKAALALRQPEEVIARLAAAVAADDITALLPALMPVAAENVRNAIKSKKEREAFQPHGFSLLAEQIGQTLAEIDKALRIDFCAEVRRRSEGEKLRLNALSFGDLLSKLAQALRDPRLGPQLRRSVRARYRVALIDEFQDTDPLQLHIFRDLFAQTHPLFFIGDPKQAIYSFRGADIFAYLEAAQIAERRYTLDKNWRSESGLVEAVNALFRRSAEPFVFPQIIFQPALAQGKDEDARLRGDNLAPGCVIALPSAEDGTPLGKGAAAALATQAVVGEITELLGGDARIGFRRVRPGDIAVLVRTNSQAEEVQAALRVAGVAAVFGGCGSIMKSEQMRELHLLLRFIAHGEGSAVLAGPLFGQTPQELFMSGAAPEGRADLHAQLARYREIWQRSGVGRMLNTFFAEFAVVQRLLGQADGARALTNLRHALEVLVTGPAAPEALLQWLHRRENDPQTDEDELRLETDAEAVQIITIHKSKGLEYGIVFCPFLWSARPPATSGPVLAHMNGELVCDYGSADYALALEQARREQLSEDLRLLYVALTRAVHRFYIVWGEIRDADGSALACLLGGAQRVLDLPQEDSALFSAVNFTGAKSVSPLPTDTPAATSAAARIFPAQRGIFSWRTSSFSTLTAGHALPAPATLTAPAEAAQILPFSGFGRGKTAPAANETGTCIHEILELCDLTTPDENLVRQTLTRFGLADPQAHLDVADPVTEVCALLRRVGARPLPGGEAGLRARAGGLAEMPFTLPLRERAFPAALLEYFGDFPGYSQYLQSLSFQQLRGFLTGIIDLVALCDGKWHIVDWKTNFLGRSPEDYRPDRLREAMNASHYHLQYTLYIIALRRYLAQRLPEADFPSVFGGAHYVFLRGMDGDGGGWFSHQPDFLRLRRLEEEIFCEPPGI